MHMSEFAFCSGCYRPYGVNSYFIIGLIKLHIRFAQLYIHKESYFGTGMIKTCMSVRNS